MAEPDSVRLFTLQIENELQVLAGEHSPTIQLLGGNAEIFGTEMVNKKEYILPPHSSIAIFTWQGCSIRITGKTKSANIVSDTLMILNVVLHASLQELRNKANAENTKGPVTLIVGPTDVGKSSLCQILLNYASRLGNRPIFVDLDVGQSTIGVPGTVGYLEMDKPSDIVEGFDKRSASVYHFGYKSPGHKIALYCLLLKQLGIAVQSYMSHASKNVISSGVVINTCGWVRGLGYKTITFAAMAFEIDIVCVLGDERLCTQLEKDMPSGVKVHFIPKMRGVVERSRSLRSQTRNVRIREYFYGPMDNLHPSSFEINFSEIKVFKVLFQPLLENFDFMNVKMDSVILQSVSLSQELFNQVLGLSSAERVTDSNELLRVKGFVLIKHVDMDKDSITVLTLRPSPLPSKILLLGDIRLMEQI